MTLYLSRSAWTSTSASGVTLTGDLLVGVAVHWPGTTQDVIGDPGQDAIASRLRSYRNYHVNTRGWQDIGYNFAIDQGGRVWMLRSTAWRGNLVGAHCASPANQLANHKYVGVLLILGDQEAPSTKMIAAFRDWYHGKFLPGWPGRTDVRGHSQVYGASTSCPGSRARAAIDSMTQKSSSGSGGTTTTKEEDMPTADEIALAVWRYKNENLEAGDAYSILRRARNGADALLDNDQFAKLMAAAARIDLGVARLADDEMKILTAIAGLGSSLTAELGKVGVTVTQDAVEQALRNVLGSLDQPTP